MSVFRRGNTWWYKFRFGGKVIRESSKSDSKTVARDAERAPFEGVSWRKVSIELKGTAQL